VKNIKGDNYFVLDRCVSFVILLTVLVVSTLEGLRGQMAFASVFMRLFIASLKLF